MEYPLIIEFIGIAGCGKTTRALRTVSALRKNGFKIWSRIEQKRFSISVIRTFLLHPLRSLIFINDERRKSILAAWENIGGKEKNNNPTLHTKWWAWMDLWRLFQARIENKNQVAVLDEGIMQHLISAYSGKLLITDNFLKFAEKYIECTKKHIFVIVETSPEICAERLMKRGNMPKRMNGLSREKVSEYLKNDKSILDIIRHNLQPTSAKVIIVNGVNLENDVEIITEEAIGKLKG